MNSLKLDFYSKNKLENKLEQKKYYKKFINSFYIYDKYKILIIYFLIYFFLITILYKIFL